jgi:hypothetical protein
MVVLELNFGGILAGIGKRQDHGANAQKIEASR